MTGAEGESCFVGREEIGGFVRCLSDDLITISDATSYTYFSYDQKVIEKEDEASGCAKDNNPILPVAKRRTPAEPISREQRNTIRVEGKVMVEECVGAEWDNLLRPCDCIVARSGAHPAPHVSCLPVRSSACCPLLSAVPHSILSFLLRSL